MRMNEGVLLIANGLFFLVTTLLALLVDGNGRLLGLNAALSGILATGIYLGAFGAVGIFIAKMRGWARWLGFALIVFYLLTLLPAIVP